ncbi:hypothetical protein [Streptomyces sp. CNQ085]|uniref:hypothetical protein n=1 Tax=Streptomyces sp. CNQ085 TaxID=2886944 RepID=UPI0027E51D69|nr:hypothetical protein [Streptomyces sp. CNQ085]
MNSTPIPPQTSGRRASGATALAALDARGGGHRHRRHLLGDTVRAISVFAGAAFDVAVLGDYAEARDEDREQDSEQDSAQGRERGAREDRAHEPAARI